MENFKLSITDTRTGEETNLSANDIVIHMGKNDEHQMVVMGCIEFVQMLHDKELLGDEAADIMFTEYFASVSEKFNQHFDDSPLAQVVEMKDILDKRDA
ncbi:hypothetical protein [Bacillus mycoides]|uniref:hypothetical protein n=1 Tax=Bacillus mycoides TaxID=1405 RepID=UPI003D652C75